MPYAISLRIPVDQYLPFDLNRGRQYVNVSAFSDKDVPVGKNIVLHENCRFAQVVDTSRTTRDVSSFDFNLSENLDI